MDPNTLHLMDALVNITCGVTIGIAWFLRRSERYFAWWAGAFLVFGVGLLLKPLVASNQIFGALQYGLLTAGVMMILAGIRNFDGKTSMAPWMAASPVLPTVIYLGGGLAGLPAVICELSGFASSWLLSLLGIAQVFLFKGETSIYRRLAGGTMLAQCLTTALIVLLAGAILDQTAVDIAIPLADQLFSIALITSIFGMSVDRGYRRMQNLAYSDALTGVLNRTGLALRFPKAEARAGVVIADLDHFKGVNDRYGHLGGDAVLREFANRTSACLPQTGLIARLGGEEFVVVLPDADHVETTAVAHRILLATRRDPIVWGEEFISATVSLGISMVHRGEDLEAAISRADAALYRAKMEGRNRVAA
ncbi:GGDEF domain-containing protein [Aureimonas psammosilenae]|uniref:GGDEF domain-containing protein n=1 Tax=Aureimonas psammosilenae TaxID=2495496 RepID=UPI0012604EB3|nr:GGDEF domain-containing protein [Aureimonas psammosilenae]